MRLRLLLWERGEHVLVWSASHSHHHYTTLFTQENSSIWTCREADMLHLL